MMWLMWHMWVLLALSALLGGVIGWILRGARPEGTLRLPPREKPVAADPVPAAEPAKPMSSPEPAKPETVRPAPVAAKTGADATAGPDDLTRIKGLGPKAESTLAEAGVFHFRQVAAWSAADIEKYDALLNARGRIVRDDWVGQAKELAES
ncbi:hypothetical protein [Glycocaulis sp.]|uniref:hypothetical protein n=1 Tax=Glycocaulis sp. TaxID=1969725 RepID=UPI003F723083